MTQIPKKRSKPEAAEKIIHSDEGRLTYMKRAMLDWRDKGFLDDPFNLIDEPIEGKEPILDILADTLNMICRTDEAERRQSFINNGKKPCGGYYKVKRGHRLQTKLYEGANDFSGDLSAPQIEIYCKVYKRANELKPANPDSPQRQMSPTGYPRLYADHIYRKNGLPTGSRRYAIRKGAIKHELASWFGDRSDEWLALSLPNPKREVVNAFAAYLTPEPDMPDGLEIYEAHQLPPFFGFEIDSDVVAAAEVHEAALEVERLDGLLPPDTFRTLVRAAMLLQLKSTTLGDMTAKADPTNPHSPTFSEAIELGEKQAKENRARGKKTGEKNKEDKETKKEFVLGILQEALASRTFTKAQAIDLVRGEWRSKWKFKPSDLPHRTAERYINELRRSGLIPGWK